MKNESPRPPAEDRVREELRGLPTPAPDLSYRARLREAFAGGTIESSARSSPLGRPTPWVRAATVPLAAAAALLVALALDRPPEWRLDGASGLGLVVVDGRPIPVSDHAALAAVMRSGAEVSTPAGVQLDLRLPGVALMQITPSTTTRIPNAPGRWLGRSMGARFSAGEVRLSTGPGFRGARLRLTTPETTIEVTGTTIAAIRDSTGSCVCVFEGAARMIAGGTSDGVVEAGTRRFEFNDGRPPRVEPIPPDELMKLTMLRDLAATHLAR